MKVADSNIFFNNWSQDYPSADYGKGIYFYDTEGRRYLDGVGGIYVNSIGYGVQEIADAMARQACKLNFSHRLRFTHEPQEQLARTISAMTPSGMERVFFTTGGSTANEMALRMVRQYHIERGKPGKHKVVGRWHGFHGSTISTMSMSGDELVRKDMEPYHLNFPHIRPANCYQCPFQLTHPGCQLACADDLATVIEREGAETVAAFVAEPIVGGVGSALPPPSGYFAKIRTICDQYDVLFIADEVITGFGRTGKNFGLDHWQVIPDLMTTAKALSSGYAPIGAVIAHQHVWETFVTGKRKGIAMQLTYSGHPISCATALAVQEYVAKHGLIERCATIGRYLKQQLQSLAEREPLIGDVRGEGLLLGLEFVQDRTTHRPFPLARQVQQKIVQAAYDEGLIVVGRSGTGSSNDGDHLSIAPAFIISESECNELVAMLERSIKQVAATL